MRHESVSPRHLRGRGHYRLSMLSVVTALLILVGSGIALYPMTASWFSAVVQTQEGDRYVHTVSGLEPDVRAQALRDAEAYNASLADGTRIVDPFAAIAETTVKTDDPYWGLLSTADDGVMAQLRIPSLDLKLPIFHGTGADVLSQGIGHLQGTALPVGGRGSHAVLTGHRGLPQADLFTRLDQMRVGDTIEIDVYGQTLVYAVTRSETVIPSETESLRPVPGRDLITLVTCTPIGINSHRILVTAERVLPTPMNAGAPLDAVGFPWWTLLFAVVFIGSAVYLWRTRVLPGTTRRPAESPQHFVRGRRVSRSVRHEGFSTPASIL